MKLSCLIQAASVTGVAVFMMAASASAGTIMYTTNATGTGGTGFVGDSTPLILNSAPGSTAGATLTFDPNPVSSVSTPSIVDYGNFVLTCTLCSPTAGSTFNGFTFDVIITDATDVATGEFVGTSAGGTIFSNSSTISIVWSAALQPPTQLGPGAYNEITGNFNTTFFTINSPTGIVAPNSGSTIGETTVQGFVNSSAVPEPATLGLVGGALFGLGLLRRKGFSGR